MAGIHLPPNRSPSRPDLLTTLDDHYRTSRLQYFDLPVGIPLPNHGWHGSLVPPSVTPPVVDPVTHALKPGVVSLSPFLRDGSMIPPQPWEATVRRLEAMHNAASRIPAPGLPTAGLHSANSPCSERRDIDGLRSHCGSPFADDIDEDVPLILQRAGGVSIREPSDYVVPSMVQRGRKVPLCDDVDEDVPLLLQRMVKMPIGDEIVEAAVAGIYKDAAVRGFMSDVPSAELLAQMDLVHNRFRLAPFEGLPDFRTRALQFPVSGTAVPGVSTIHDGIPDEHIFPLPLGNAAPIRPTPSTVQPTSPPSISTRISTTPSLPTATTNPYSAPLITDRGIFAQRFSVPNRMRTATTPSLTGEPTVFPRRRVHSILDPPRDVHHQPRTITVTDPVTGETRTLVDDDTFDPPTSYRVQDIHPADRARAELLGKKRCTRCRRWRPAERFEGKHMRCLFCQARIQAGTWLTGNKKRKKVDMVAEEDEEEEQARVADKEPGLKRFHGDLGKGAGAGEIAGR